MLKEALHVNLLYAGNRYPCEIIKTTATTLFTHHSEAKGLLVYTKNRNMYSNNMIMLRFQQF